MTCEAIHAFGSWPILLPVIAIGFGLGAFWQKKRTADFYNRRALNLSAEVDEALSQSAGQSRGTVAVRRRVTQRSEHPARGAAIGSRGARSF